MLFLTSAFGKTHSYEHKYACAYWHVDLVLPSFLYSELNTQHQDAQQLNIILWFSPVSTLGLHTYIYYAYAPFISSAYLSSRSTLKYSNYSSQVLGFICLKVVASVWYIANNTAVTFWCMARISTAFFRVLWDESPPPPPTKK